MSLFIGNFLLLLGSSYVLSYCRVCSGSFLFTLFHKQGYLLFRWYTQRVLRNKTFIPYKLPFHITFIKLEKDEQWLTYIPGGLAVFSIVNVDANFNIFDLTVAEIMGSRKRYANLRTNGRTNEQNYIPLGIHSVHLKTQTFIFRLFPKYVVSSAQYDIYRHTWLLLHRPDLESRS